MSALSERACKVYVQLKSLQPSLLHEFASCKSAVHCCLVSIAAETARDAIDAMMQFATLRLRTWWEFTPLVQL